MYQQFLGCIAHRWALGFRVEHDAAGHIEIRRLIDENMAVTRARLDDRNNRILDHVGNELRAATGNNYINQTSRGNEILHAFSSARIQQFDCSARHAANGR